MLQDKKDTAVKLIIFSLILVGLVVAIFLGVKVFQNKQRLLGYSKLSVNVFGNPADVIIDGTKVGTTPLDLDSVKPGTHTIKLQNENNFYEESIMFSKNSQVVISRDLGISKLFSSGQTFSLDDKDLSSKINVVSEPSQAKVFIDDAEVGKTPYSSTALTDGEYDLRIEKDGYEPQIARIKIQKSFKLNVLVQLFPIPVPEKVVGVGTSTTVLDLSSSLDELFLDPASWAKGVVYWNVTRQNSLKLSYFVDYAGAIYDTSGKVMEGSDKIALKAGDTIGYLGRKSDNGITTDAQTALARFGESAGASKVKVLNTGTGWLRVRSEPSLDGTEIGRLNVGEEVPLLEEKGSWVKVSLPDGKEGWVAASYVSKIKS